MHDSDDSYFSDDLVLDDQTLAVLDEEESKFKRNTSQTQQDVGPPAKRQKTTTICQPAKILYRSGTLDDTEDLPDVSIRHDGTYELQDRQRPASGSSTRPRIASGPPVVTQLEAGRGPPSAASVYRGSVPPVRDHSATGPARGVQPPARPPPSTRGIRVSQPPTPSQGVSRSQSRSHPHQHVSKRAPTTASDAYVADLLQQIEELRRKNEMTQAEMESTLNAKFVKEGEVTNLRKRLEKTAQEHSAQLAKLKSAKEEADAKHLLLQKQYEADRERLKTEFTFRQLELETSMRKPPGSVRPKKIAQGVAPTPSPVPSQPRFWGQGSVAGPSRPAPESPRRPRFGVISDFERPKKGPSADARNLPSGFQTGPPHSQVVAGSKGKGKAPHIISQAPLSSPLGSPTRQGPTSQNFQPDVFFAQVDDAGHSDDFPPVDVDIPNDVNMVDETNPATTPSPVEEEIANVGTLQDWNSVLHRTILTHILEGSKMSTLQLLMGASIADTDQAQSYSAALTQILDILASVPNHPGRDFNHLATAVCCALCETAKLLATNDLITPLTALLNLLINLSYTLPSFHAPLMSQRTSEQDETPQLLWVLCKIIRDQLRKLDTAIEQEQPELCSLGKQTLSLLEVLVLKIPDDLEDVLSAIPLSPSVITILLQPNRPQWFLIESVRVLLWLSTRRVLFRSLLSFPEFEQEGNDVKPPDFTHLPQIDLACSLLADTDRKGPEADELKSHIIMFFGMLSTAHPNAYTLLVESQELIPSMVFYLYHLVTRIWNEDEVLSNDPQAASRTICMINHTTLLLHHLVIGEDSTLNLRERLYRAPMKTYGGLIHFFILTFGRLSYANSPYWLDAKDRQRLVQVAEIARPLLELVIQGPELDSIWETYQDEAEDNREAAMDVDDEEAEARKLDYHPLTQLAQA
ncbi:hypothetical protein PAXRUDRAFT_824987 [Paxillus rubicundulus Ve08.2h10]|uniref:DNA repair protein Rad26 n=1 Tax=Paxillus rubicundulus Ve08.2h10 TaxID=930991 RepID=A0A0D0DTP6_9AGAM|nr:hypothetical protein PAXRUDRAFT_824987 [Paxillus rubicundulus Ve08.2h10]